MMGKTHKIGGAAAAFTVFATDLYIPNIEMGLLNINSLPFFIGCIFGSLVPDFDSKNSIISRKLWFIGWPIYLIQKLVNYILRNKNGKLAKKIKATINHRGIAHWLSLSLVYLFLLIIISNKLILDTENPLLFYNILVPLISYFIYGIIIGMISHIILDSFNESGTYLLAPIFFVRISLGKVKTGENSPSEKRFKLKLILVLLGLMVVCTKMKLNPANKETLIIFYLEYLFIIILTIQIVLDSFKNRRYFKI